MLVFLAGAAPFAVMPGALHDFAYVPQSAFIQVGLALALVLRLLRSATESNRDAQDSHEGERQASRSSASSPSSLSSLSSLLKDTAARIGPLALPLLAFLLWSLGSLAWALNGREGVERWLHWAACGAGCFLASAALTTRRDRRTLLAALFFSGVAVSALGLLQYFVPGLDWFPQYKGPAATFGNKNIAVQYVVLTLPAGAALFLANPSGAAVPVALWAYAAGLVVTVTYLFHTFTKAGWLAAAAGLAVFAAVLLNCGRRSRRPNAEGGRWTRGKAIAAASATAAFLVLGNLGPEGFQWRMGKAVTDVLEVWTPAGREPATESATGGAHPARAGPLEAGCLMEAARRGEVLVAQSLGLRLAMWRNTLSMAGDHPLLGVGLGNWKVRFPLHSNRPVAVPIFDETIQPRNAHNDYVQALAELGPVGLCLLAWLAYAVVRTFLRAFGRAARGTEGDPPPAQRVVIRGDPPPGGDLALHVAAIAASAVALLVDAAFSFPFQTAVPPFCAAMLLGALMSAGRDDGDGAGRGVRTALPGPAPRWLTRWLPRWLPLVAALVVLGLLARHQYHRIAADRHYRSVLDARRRYGLPDRVLAEAREVLRHDPSFAMVHKDAGWAHLEAGRHREAADALERVLAAYPYDLSSLNNAGVAYGRLGEYEKALERVRLALEIKPDSAKAHNNAGYYMRKLGRLDEAAAAYGLALRHDPGLGKAHHGLGLVALRKGDLDEAVARFRLAVRRDPMNALFRHTLGQAAMANGDFDEALAAHGRAARLAPGKGRYHLEHGHAAFRKKLYPEARAAFAKAVQLEPRLATAHRGLGMVLFLFLDRKEEGAKHLARALELNPRMRDAARVREMVRSVRGGGR